MRNVISPLCFALFLTLSSGIASAQGGGGNLPGGSGAAPGGGFEGADSQLGAERVGPDDIVDNRSATATGENNRALGGGQAAANNMNFLSALFGGNLGNQNVNQNTPLRGRGIRAPLRLGFQFDGVSVEAGASSLNARLVRIPKLQDREITCVLEDRTLLLVGEVSSPEEASLAVRIARFEPGVDQVKSLLTVANPVGNQ